jgi:hypothetical protein
VSWDICRALNNAISNLNENVFRKAEKTILRKPNA